VRSALADWHLSALDETVSLLVTELVSNGVRHAGTQLELILTLDGSCLRIALQDGDTHPPVARERHELTVGGFGLTLIESLSSEWGTDIDDGVGKTVWFEIDTSDLQFAVGR
jgi:two-component sensor histidine kinase